MLISCCVSFANAQNSMILDDAIIDAVDFFSSRLPSGSIVAITNYEAETKELSNFVIDELIVALANTGNIRVVERNRLEMLHSELDFNMSGYVSDETAQGIGHMLGAQILISGSISEYRDMYRMSIRAIQVETAEIIGTRTINVQWNSTLTGLLGRINPVDKWKYQWLYFGASFGYSVTFLEPVKYMDTNRLEFDLKDIPFGYSIYAMVQPFDLFGIALDVTGNMYTGINILAVPTLILRPSSFEVNLFFGAGINVLYTNFVLSGGLKGGYHVGPGVLFADVRLTNLFFPFDGYHHDENGYELYAIYGTDTHLYMHFSIGYTIGFISRKK